MHDYPKKNEEFMLDLSYYVNDRVDDRPQP